MNPRTTADAVSEAYEVCEYCDEQLEAGEEHTIRCVHCGACTKGDEVVHNGNSYCDYCFNDLYAECFNCGDTTPRDDMDWYDDERYCRSCYLDVSQDDDEQDPEGFREYSRERLPAYIDDKAGKYIKSRRIFSAELECYYPDADSFRSAARDLPRAMGIAADGSLGSRGVEYQTPMLAGRAGEQTIVKACEVLNREGFTLNMTAGLHIHLDGEGLFPERKLKDEPVAIKNLLTFYTAFEDVLLSFLPASRRGNRYCDLLSKLFSVRDIQNMYKLEAIEKAWYQARTRADVKYHKDRHYHESRYTGVNLHSLLSSGHLEIRYHSGTLNAQKILEWVNLHQTILDLCVPEKREMRMSYRSFMMPEYEIDSNGDFVRVPTQEPKEKTRKVYRLVNLMPLDRVLKAMNITDPREKAEEMYEILNLPIRARRYFRARQKTFTSNKANKGEAANLHEVCAE